MKSSLPNKPSEPKKVPEFNVFPDSIFSIKPLSFSEILNQKAQQDYQKDYRAYEKARQKVQKDYDREYNAYKKQTNDIIHWLGTNGNQEIVFSVEDSAGIRKEIHSFADIKEWIDKHDYDNTIKSDFREYKEAR